MSIKQRIMGALVAGIGMAARMVIVVIGAGTVARTVIGPGADEWQFWLVAGLVCTAYAFAALVEFAGNRLMDEGPGKEAV